MNTIPIRSKSLHSAYRWIQAKYNLRPECIVTTEMEKEFNCKFKFTEDGFISEIRFNTAADKTFFLLRWE